MSTISLIAADLEPLDPDTPRRAPVIAVMAEKGGVGKSTTAANLAAWLGRSSPARPTGMRVLAIDAEPQGHLAVKLGAAEEIEVDDDQGTLADALACAEGDYGSGAFENFEVFFDEHPLAETAHENVILLRGGEQLVEARHQINGGGESGEHWLSLVCEYFASHFDLIVIDTPPSVSSPLTIGAFFAADLIVTPVDATDELAIRSLDTLATHVGMLGDEAPPLLPFGTLVREQRKLWRQIDELVRSEGENGYLQGAAQLAGSVVPDRQRRGPWLSIVPYDIQIKTAGLRAEPITVGPRSGSPAGMGFRDLADRALTLARNEVEASR